MSGSPRYRSKEELMQPITLQAQYYQQFDADLSQAVPAGRAMAAGNVRRLRLT